MLSLHEVQKGRYGVRQARQAGQAGQARQAGQVRQVRQHGLGERVQVQQGQADRYWSPKKTLNTFTHVTDQFPTKVPAPDNRMQKTMKKVRCVVLVLTRPCLL
jgi:hypothetical protein